MAGYLFVALLVVCVILIGILAFVIDEGVSDNVKSRLKFALFGLGALMIGSFLMIEDKSEFFYGPLETSKKGGGGPKKGHASGEDDEGGMKSAQKSSDGGGGGKKDESGRENEDADSRFTTVKDCDVCPTLVLIKPGSGVLGALSQANKGLVQDGPFRPITLTQGYFIGRYEITRGQYQSFLKETGYKPSASCATGGAQPGSYLKPGFDQNDNHPITCVSWTDAQIYVEWLSQKAKRAYRLPSEIEWEFAARAGSSGNYADGDKIARSQANYSDIREGKSTGTTQVGFYKGNKSGIYDAHGNVWEMTENCWTENYASVSAASKDGEKPDCSKRIIKGGSWKSPPGHIRSAVRSTVAPDAADNGIGFRVARDPDTN